MITFFVDRPYNYVIVKSEPEQGRHPLVFSPWLEISERQARTAIVELAKAQMRASLASLTLTALASGDVVVSITRKAGHGNTLYAHVEKLTRRLKHLEKAR